MTAEDWPQLLGPLRNGEIAGVAVEPWPANGPRKVWSHPLGEGFAGPAVGGDRVLVFHRSPRAQETLEALDSSTGRSLWQSSYPTSYRDDFGFDEGPRAVPVVADDRVFTVGAQGRLTAWSLETGKQLWQRDTRAEFDVPKGFFGVAASPLVIGNRVLLNVGGAEAGVVAFDAETGSTLWQRTSDEQSYAAPTRWESGSGPVALFFTREGLVGLSPEDGAEQLRFAHKTRIRSSVNAATPLVVGNRVFLSAEYGAGAVLLEIEEGSRTLREVWADGRTLNNHYATSVHRSGVLYGFHGRQESGPALRAVELESGKVLWSQDRFGAGSVLLAGDRLLILLEDGDLLMVAADPGGYRELARASVLGGVVRAYPAFADGQLFVRGPDALVALEIPTTEP